MTASFYKDSFKGLFLTFSAKYIGSHSKLLKRNAARRELNQVESLTRFAPAINDLVIQQKHAKDNK